MLATEVVSACENVCSDFGWLVTLSEVLRNVGILIGVGVAWWQLGNWRREKIALKRSDLAEELIATTAEIVSNFDALRSPFGYGPPEGEDDDGTYDFVRRLRELGELDEAFGKLRHLRVRQKALIASDLTDRAIGDIFEARTKLMTALRMKIVLIRGQQRRGVSYTEDQIDREERYERIIWEDGEDGDPIRELLEPAIEVIEAHLSPILRIEKILK